MRVKCSQFALLIELKSDQKYLINIMNTQFAQIFQLKKLHTSTMKGSSSFVFPKLFNTILGLTVLGMFSATMRPQRPHVTSPSAIPK